MRELELADCRRHHLPMILFACGQKLRGRWVVLTKISATPRGVTDPAWILCC